MHVLIVDNANGANKQARLFRSWGLDVHVAHDAATAFEMVHECQPDVMLIAVELPGRMDGCTLAKRVRTLCDLNRPMLFAITDRNDAKVREQIEEAGFDEFFLEPVDPLILKELMWEAAHAVTVS